MSENNFLGTGWHFPPTFEGGGGGAQMVAGKADIEQSLEIILGTIPGERVMRPDFGCNLQEIVFESMSTTLLTYIRDMVERAILYHEPRIDLKKVNMNTAELTEGKILIEIDYVIRTTNSRMNYVYPYYINEATDLKK
jgi:phage baseplate assembly protein W